MWRSLAGDAGFDRSGLGTETMRLQRRQAVLRQYWLITACLLCQPLFAQASGKWETNFAQAETEAKRLGRPLLVHFYAPWCGPCRKMEAQVLNTPELHRTISDHFVAVKVDIDKQPNVADRFKIKLLPSDCIVSPQGQVIYRSEGPLAKGSYIATLETTATRFATQQLANQRQMDAAKQKALSVSGNGTPALQKQPAAPKQILAMDGYCPVTLWRNREWVKGDASLGLVYLGVIFHFRGVDERDAFQANADQFAPRLSGCDPVVFWETHRAVQGSPKFGAFYNSRLYLFENLENRTKFRENPERYLQSRETVQAESIEHPTLR